MGATWRPSIRKVLASVLGLVALFVAIHAGQLSHECVSVTHQGGTVRALILLAGGSVAGAVALLSYPRKNWLFWTIGAGFAAWLAVSFWVSANAIGGCGN